MSNTSSIESAVRLPRLASTLKAARAYSRQAEKPLSIDGQARYNMRSAMGLHPGIGKWISRRVVNERSPEAWALADLDSSRFADLDEITRAVAGIQRDGFYVFDKGVAPSITEEIRAFAEQAPCIARGAGTPAATYPRSAPTVGRYDLEEAVSLQCPEVQEFATDPVMARISQLYLGQPVMMDEVAFWWTTTQRAQDANVNAQQFHQDRDRLSFLKFFIYLTDVTPDTGPHVYLKGSHRQIPRSMRGDGRKTDEAVREAGLWQNVTELTGPAGTLMAVDTIGLHKGKTPTAGDRLALETEFATSLFGMDYERPAFHPTDLAASRFKQMPWVLQRYEPAVNA